MPTHDPSLAKPDASEKRLQMEQTIDRLADHARSNLDLGQFFSEILSAAVDPGGAIQARLWDRSAESMWRIAVEYPNRAGQDVDFVAEQQALLTDVSTEVRPRILSMRSLTGMNGSKGDWSRMLIPIQRSGQTLGILESEHKSVVAGQLPAEIVRFFAMVCEITADYLAQHELQELRTLKRLWQKWDQFSQQLWHSLKLNSICAAIANDGRLVVESDRISVLIRHGHSFRLRSVSGVDRIEPRSAATRAIELLATSLGSGRKPVWIDRSGSAIEEQTDQAIRAPLQRYLAECQVTCVGVVPVNDVAEQDGNSLPRAIVIFDQFTPVGNFAGWRSRAELLVSRAAPALRASIELSEIPWIGIWQRLRRSRSWMGRPTALLSLLIAVAAIAILVFVPAQFTIASPAELWPAHRREVFVSTSGIVNKVLVAHGDEVEPGHALIVLRDPELETDAPRVEGEIATINERLKGVQAARFAGNNSADANSRARQLAADEEELKERLRTLERQRLLIEERTTALTLRSPIAGKVLTWDVAQHLLDRPVERGQSLMTLGETGGAWIIEARVSDKDVGHLQRARKDSNPNLPVEFMMASEPGRVFRGEITELALSSELDEAGRSYVRAVIAFNSKELEQPRPGATVLSRIHCGRKPIGYVWLHDLIDAIRTRLLF